METPISISAVTKLCAVIGNPISHSLSPAIHNAAFKKLGLDYIYVAFRVEDLKNALEGMRALGNFRGMSVTIPHKIEAMKYLDEIADIDRQIGSINTIIKEENRLIGLGTDGPGALKAILDKGVGVKNSNILILGSGGAARAISFTLAKNASPAEIAILDINKQLLAGLTTDLTNGTDTPILSGLLSDDSLEQAMKKADIIIHCTPTGMHPNEDATLIPKHFFRQEQVVFDIVYTPYETKLLSDAKSCGLKVIHGVEMFINQAILQFERFTGIQAPEETMKSVVMEYLKS